MKVSDPKLLRVGSRGGGGGKRGGPGLDLARVSKSRSNIPACNHANKIFIPNMASSDLNIGIMNRIKYIGELFFGHQKNGGWGSGIYIYK